jgi:hypothetical protein
MEKIITVILTFFSVLFIFIGIVRQVDYSDKYELTKAVLDDFELKGAGRNTIRICTYNYVVGGEKYVAVKKCGSASEERIIGYKKSNPSEYKIGRAEPAAKVLFVIGIACVLFAIWILCEFILYESYSDHIFRFILLYAAVGLTYLFEESFFLTLLTVISLFFTICIFADGISICFDFLGFFKRIMLFKKTSL